MTNARPSCKHNQCVCVLQSRQYDYVLYICSGVYRSMVMTYAYSHMVRPYKYCTHVVLTIRVWSIYSNGLERIHCFCFIHALQGGSIFISIYSDKSSVCGQKQWKQLLKLENRWLLPRCTAPSEQITWKWRLVTPDSWEETNYDITTFKYVHTTRLYCIIIEIIGVQQIFSKNGWISLLLPIKYNFFHSQNPRNINYRVTQQPIYL